MDERLLTHYNAELRYLREMGAEFAREYPKIAGRLSLDREGKESCPDPFVERLLEGFAFLAARVHLKLDSEFPRFTQGLLETVFPQYLAPIPSMAIVRFEPEFQEGALASGYPIPRGTALRSDRLREEKTSCEYRTAHEVLLWPVKLAEARYFVRDLPQLGLPSSVNPKAAILLRLQAVGGKPFKGIPLHRIDFQLVGDWELTGSLYEQVFGHATGLLVRPAKDKRKPWVPLPPAAIQPVGFQEHEALLPHSARGFGGYRLLREYFAFARRFLFFGVRGLDEGTRGTEGDLLDVVILLDQEEPRLEGRVDASLFNLYATPAINLFEMPAVRIGLSDRFYEFHVVPDRARPLDFEVYDVQQVAGTSPKVPGPGEAALGTGIDGQRVEFRPFYRSRDIDRTTGAFFSVYRSPRLQTDRERRLGKALSKYAGSEVFLSLVDSRAAPYSGELKELEVKTVCTNRHLPLRMPLGTRDSDFSFVNVSPPVTSVRCVGTPSEPIPSMAGGETAWQLISHLSLNYLSLLEVEGGDAAGPLREMLGLYVMAGEAGRHARRQVDGLRAAKSTPVIQRVPRPGPVAFARGLEVELRLEDGAFEGSSPFLFGAVLDHFFTRYVSLNSFTRTVVRTEQRGEIMRWPARTGKRQIL